MIMYLCITIPYNIITYQYLKKLQSLEIINKWKGKKKTEKNRENERTNLILTDMPIQLLQVTDDPILTCDIIMQFIHWLGAL